MKLITLIIAGVLSLFLLSCRKQQPDCNGNCTSVAFKGVVINKSAGKGIAGIPVTAEWHIRSYCIGCTVYEIKKATSKDDGSFSFGALIDTNFFKKYYLSIKVPADSNYFIRAVENEAHYFAKRYYSLDELQLNQPIFSLYEKVPLTIRLHRTQPDNFNDFVISHTFLPNEYLSSNIIYNVPVAHDTTLLLTTAPNVYTKIYQRKNFPGYTFEEATDSLICTVGGSNAIDINY